MRRPNRKIVPIFRPQQLTISPHFGDLQNENRQGYNGKTFDPMTGLYNYGFRDYAPELGRFTTVDPIQAGDLWYAYCGNDPVDYLDPTGLREAWGAYNAEGDTKEERESGQAIEKEFRKETREREAKADKAEMDKLINMQIAGQAYFKQAYFEKLFNVPGLCLATDVVNLYREMYPVATFSNSQAIAAIQTALTKGVINSTDNKGQTDTNALSAIISAITGNPKIYITNKTDSVSPDDFAVSDNSLGIAEVKYGKRTHYEVVYKDSDGNIHYIDPGHGVLDYVTTAVRPASRGMSVTQRSCI